MMCVGEEREVRLQGATRSLGIAFLLLVGIGLALMWGRPFLAAPSARETAAAVTPTVSSLPPTATPTPLEERPRARASTPNVRPLDATGPSATVPTPATMRLSPYERIPTRGDDYGVPPLPQVITYTVRPGDTMSSIAARFGLTLDTLRWSNPEFEHNPDDIYPGDVLRIPPINGVVVEVQEGDTVERLAQRYNVPPEVIRDYAANRLSPPYRLQPGTLIVIPGGSKERNLPPPQAYPGYAYMWPARGVITQRFSARHKGVDIATIYGAYVYASRGGRVRTVTWDDTGYGYMVIIDHGDGWNTLYAHLKGALVQPGQSVHRGDIIGRVGGTGRATGPHVHFEVRKGRVRYDPMTFLPPQP